jgi:hypothetical protein
MRQQAIVSLRGLCIAAAVAMTTPGSAPAEPADRSPGAEGPLFGGRSENADGSVALTVGRRLPTPWEVKVGTEVRLPAPHADTAAENLMRSAPDARSSGAVWADVTLPSPAPMVWDNTAVEARLDAGQEQGRLGATLSRSMPIGPQSSIKLQQSYSVTQTLADRAPGAPVVPMIADPLPTGAVAGSASWRAGQSMRLDLDSSGTALSFGGARTSDDEHWHSKLSVEQKMFGPLKVTTSIEDPGTAASRTSISAAFKRVW